MKRFIILFIALCLTMQVYCQKKDGGLLSSKYSVEELKGLLPPSNTLAIPKIEDRQGWSKADQQMLKANYEEALKRLDYRWPSLPATMILAFERNGNRSKYDSISFEKRRVLLCLLFAEIYENQGRFLDQIADGLWSICEESYWGSSAHINQSRSGAGLPDVSDPHVDLFSAETGDLLACTDYILGTKLEKYSKQLRPRIAYEIDKRIFKPVLAYNHWWMGFSSKNGSRPNNWNPWICSNWLNTTLLMIKDPKEKAEMVNRILQVLDNFLTPYPQDGGCDEGPGYWDAAGAALYDNLEILNFATGNAFDYAYQNEKIKNIGRYIYRVQIGENYFLNFADASPKVKADAPLVWRFGRDIKDEPMMQFAAYYRAAQHGTFSNFRPFRTLFDLFTRAEFEKTQAKLPFPRTVWLPDTQIMTCRDVEGSSKGWFLGAKGGHNAESHNHNDVGNFVIFYDGLPLLIDVGSGTYTAKTFSSRRYEIWYNSSAYHNTPSINGIEQSPGREFKARNVSHKGGKMFDEISLDIAEAYSADAGIIHWLRTMRLNRNKNVEIQENFALKKPSEIENHLMTCYPVDDNGKGRLTIHYAPDGVKSIDFELKYDPSQWRVSVEKIKMDKEEDLGVKRNWGENIQRINFTSVKKVQQGHSSFVISKAPFKNNKN